MNLLTKCVIVLVLLAGAFGAGRYLTPAKIETKEVVKTNTEYITRETTQKDGTVIKETIKKDQVSIDKSNKIENAKPNYKATLIAKADLSSGQLTYGALVEKRILLNIFAGVYADSNKNVGISIGMEF